MCVCLYKYLYDTHTHIHIHTYTHTHRERRDLVSRLGSAILNSTVGVAVEGLKRLVVLLAAFHELSQVSFLIDSPLKDNLTQLSCTHDLARKRMCTIEFVQEWKHKWAL